MIMKMAKLSFIEGGRAMSKLQRCRALRTINARQGLIRPRTKGTIESQTDNLGRRLIKVQWDDGVEMYVFSHEIEMIETVATDRDAA